MDAADRELSLARGFAGGWRPCFVLNILFIQHGKSTFCHVV